MDSIKFIQIAACATILLMMAACKQAPMPEPVPDPEMEQETETPTQPDALAHMLSLVGPEQAVTSETMRLSWEGKDKTFLNSVNRFSFDLYGRLGTESVDFVFSPLSVQYVLGMLQDIADEQTSQEIRKVLGIEHLSRETVGGYYQFLLDALPAVDNEIALSLSNAFLVDETIGIFPDGQQKLARHYHTVVEKVDFSKSKEVVDLVNAWCNKHTNGLIPILLPESIDFANMIACLMNALYFKGGWSEEFNANLNGRKVFHPAQGEGKEITFLSNKLSFIPVYEDDTYTAFSLPLGKYQSYRWTGILPKKEKDLKKTVAWLSQEGWNQIQANRAKEDIEIFLPKFSTEADEIQLVQPLREMGLQRIFSTDSRWSNLFDFRNGAPVSVLFQKAKFGIDEKGVEGAAATFGGMATANPDAPQPTFRPLVVDHPFLFVLSEAETGLILFIGQFCSGNGE